MRVKRLFVIVLAVAVCGAARMAMAHCDTFDGPVVRAAAAALEAGDATPVLRWVRQEDEAEVRATLDRARAARVLGDAAREVADQWFFETVVRLHRASEGQPFDGLKRGEPVPPAVRAADEALASGDVRELESLLVADVRAGLRERFERARSALHGADTGVEAGRAFVRAYVELTHYAERVAEFSGRPDEGVAGSSDAGDHEGSHEH